MVCTIISELAFTFYISNYGIFNIVGHYFKLFSFIMIYRAIVATGIEEPYLLIFKELSQTKDNLRAEIELRNKVEHHLGIETFEWEQTENIKREINQRFRLATEATGVGIWEWNVITNQIRWDNQMFRIYGITPTENGSVNYNDWCNFAAK